MGSSRLTSTPPTDCEITVRGFEDGQTRDKQAFVFVPGLAHYKAGYDVDPNHAPSPIPGQLNASIWCFQWCRNVRACERLKRRKIVSFTNPLPFSVVGCWNGEPV